MILGVTGTLGAGKGSVVEYLVKEKGFAHLYITDYMRSVATERGLPLVRMTFHNIGNEHRTQGPHALVEATIAWGKEKGITDMFVIEALHTPDEVRYVQERGGIVIGVDADLRTRYDRIVGRKHDKDDTTFEEFKAHEEMEMKPTSESSNDLYGALEAADYRIENDGSVEELHAKVDQVLSQAGL